MSRYTEKLPDGRSVIKKEYSFTTNSVYGSFIEGKAVDKLAAYEDADEQGLLLKLPCKVGDTVYSHCSEFGILPYMVDCIVMDDEHITYQCSSYSEPIGDCPSECLDEIEPDISEFGKTVFITREQAERISQSR